MPITIELKPTLEVRTALSQGIIDFNRNTIVDLEANDAEIRFYVIATDEQDELIGGLRASCYWNTLHIELLWLSDPARGRGTGAKILAAAEDFARAKGYEKALVETTSWQAKPFYEKHGYDLLATLEGRPKGHSSHYLTKDLTRA
ncbi:GNAT family N-acetyltransferase [Qipengyuania sp. GH1]|uniref:GNAT family N-acetyltransferase n=1 Tax=Qipengyuania aestuarii TaxID=2867241 RepID=UPI001C889E50|nr:GNAT family N-acetyltransferase [Qipengyuania aestuarii]MBX7534599.1 GNAT family N-acetyltransferase [Qipengyuania aestuarii]